MPAETKITLFTVDDDRRVGWLLAKILTSEGYAIQHFDSAPELLERIRSGQIPALVIADLQMPDMDGITLARELKTLDPALPVIIMTAYGTIETAVRAIKAGASEFVTKPINARLIKEVIRKILRDVAEGSVVAGSGDRSGMGSVDLVGVSPAFQDAVQMAKRVAATDITVLLRGESGTGKELFARTIHNLSERRSEPYVAVDCATLPETLMESELFGHEKGAFTDARMTRTGKFEAAHGGTLFLDEIGNLAPQSQMKILRAIQERTIERLGSQKTRSIDVRFIAATHVDLEESMRRGLFRDDLYYRLNEITIWIPPLRNRQADIAEFASYFLREFNRDYKRNVMGIHPDAMRVFSQYSWPGNVREFRNVMKRAVILAGDTITEKELPGEIIRTAHRGDVPLHELEVDLNEGLDLKELARVEMQRIEENIIRQTLAKTDWHLSQTAQILGVDRKTLRNKMRTYGISKK